MVSRHARLCVSISLWDTILLTFHATFPRHSYGVYRQRYTGNTESQTWSQRSRPGITSGNLWRHRKQDHRHRARPLYNQSSQGKQIRKRKSSEERPAPVICRSSAARPAQKSSPTSSRRLWCVPAMLLTEYSSSAPPLCSLEAHDTSQSTANRSASEQWTCG